MNALTPSLLRSRAERHRLLMEETTNPVSAVRHRELAEMLKLEADAWDQAMLSERRQQQLARVQQGLRRYG